MYVKCVLRSETKETTSLVRCTHSVMPFYWRMVVEGGKWWSGGEGWCCGRWHTLHSFTRPDYGNDETSKILLSSSSSLSKKYFVYCNPISIGFWFDHHEGWDDGGKGDYSKWRENASSSLLHCSLIHPIYGNKVSSELSKEHFPCYKTLLKPSIIIIIVIIIAHYYYYTRPEKELCVHTWT